MTSGPPALVYTTHSADVPCKWSLVGMQCDNIFFVLYVHFCLAMYNARHHLIIRVQGLSLQYQH